jgi:predicted nucleic acid-binding protein
VIAYAESSAVLAWLLGEPEGRAVRRALVGSERIVSSTLTLLECSRSIARGARTEALARDDQLAALRLLDHAARTWVTLEMTGKVLERARLPFPKEPVRTLDAIHLATAMIFDDAIPDLALLSLDGRIRENASALGMTVVP